VRTRGTHRPVEGRLGASGWRSRAVTPMPMANLEEDNGGRAKRINEKRSGLDEGVSWRGGRGEVVAWPAHPGTSCGRGLLPELLRAVRLPSSFGEGATSLESATSGCQRGDRGLRMRHG
jgi:hypothetical protein